MEKKLILASNSEIRATLLSRAGFRFVQEKSKVDESQIVGSNPTELSVNRAKAKADAIASSARDAVVIGADQVLAFEAGTLSKAKNLDEARAHLTKLSGAPHQLVSSICVAFDKNGVHEKLMATSVATLTMRALTETVIERYLSFNEWQGCVGCYQYENRGINLFSSVDGNESTILGLPMLELTALLRQADVCVI